METKENYKYTNHGEEGTLEWFLRRNFGLKGEFYSDEFRAVVEKIENANTKEEGDAIADKWYDAPDWEPSKNYSPEAWDAWQRALNMVDDLVKMGAISDDGIDSPASCITCAFCDNA